MEPMGLTTLLNALIVFLMLAIPVVLIAFGISLGLGAVRRGTTDASRPAYDPSRRLLLAVVVIVVGLLWVYLSFNMAVAPGQSPFLVILPVLVILLAQISSWILIIAGGVWLVLWLARRMGVVGPARETPCFSLSMKVLNYEISNITRILSFVILVCLCVACSGFPSVFPTGEDTSFLTPAAEQTVAAFRFDSPIQDRTQAVIAAQAILGSTRLHSKQIPQVASVQELSLAEVQQRMPEAGSSLQGDRPADARVWLVILKGKWQVFPPDPSHTITPAPASEGCVYVLMDANEPARSQAGTVECGR